MSRTSALKVPPPFRTEQGRSMPPGGGLVIAGAASILFWAMIAGIVAIA